MFCSLAQTFLSPLPLATPLAANATTQIGCRSISRQFFLRKLTDGLDRIGTSLLEGPMGLLLGDYMMLLERRINTMTTADITRWWRPRVL